MKKIICVFFVVLSGCDRYSIPAKLQSVRIPVSRGHDEIFKYDTSYPVKFITEEFPVKTNIFSSNDSKLWFATKNDSFFIWHCGGCKLQYTKNENYTLYLRRWLRPSLEPKRIQGHFKIRKSI